MRYGARHLAAYRISRTAVKQANVVRASAPLKAGGSCFNRRTLNETVELADVIRSSVIVNIGTLTFFCRAMQTKLVEAIRHAAVRD